MKRGASSRLHRDVNRLINIGVIGTVSDAELKRLEHAVDRQVYLKPSDESKASAARAAIQKAESDVISYSAALSTAKVDASVANAALAVAECEKKRIQERAGDFALTAPFDGLIVARNAKPLDAVRPLTGQPSAMKRLPVAPTRDATPLYVVAKVDLVRVSIDIPEQDASYVRAGTKASVVVKAYRDEPIQATVARTSWAVNAMSRVLRAEIDLPNPDGRIKLGMYAYGKLIIERPGARALPTAAVTSIDRKQYCWTYDNGRAVRTEIETGLSDGQWIEVIHRRAAGAASGGLGPWTTLDGSERIILGDPSTLRDDAPVQVAPSQTAPR